MISMMANRWTFEDEFIIGEIMHDGILGLLWIQRNKVTIEPKDENVVIRWEDGWSVQKNLALPISFCSKEEVVMAIKKREQVYAIFLNTVKAELLEFNNVTTIEEMNSQPTPARNLIKEIEGLFDKELPPGPPPRRDVGFKGDLVKGATLANIPPYRLSLKDQQEVSWQVKATLECGLIRESSLKYCAPCILVSKKDGRQRTCIDY